MNDLDKAQMMAPEGEFLAYINPKEAGILKALGGSGKLTSMGIPSFAEDEEDQNAMNAPDYSSQDNEEQQSIDRGDPTANMTTMDRDTQGYGPGTSLSDLYGGGGGGDNFIQTIGNLYNKFSPAANIGRGIRGLFDMFADLRGFNPDGSRRTQDEYEQARQDRINQNRISNIMGRDAPFTQMTLDNLSKLGYTGLMNQDLIGTTNNMRTMNDGILSVAPKSAMNNVMLADAQLSFPFDNMNTGDPYKDNLYDQDGNYKPSLDKNNLFAKVDGPAQIQMRMLEKKAGMEQFGGTPLSLGERKALEQLKKMDSDQDNVYTMPVNIV